jgi:hypothetical protein
VKTGKLGALLALGLLVGACAEDSGKGSSPSGERRKAEATVSSTRMRRKLVRFTSRVLAVEAVNPARVGVLARVKHVGQSPGRPTCRVEAEDPRSGFHGVRHFYLRMTLEPGDNERFYVPLAVTDRRAAFVTRATVDCR